MKNVLSLLLAANMALSSEVVSERDYRFEGRKNEERLRELIFDQQDSIMGIIISGGYRSYDNGAPNYSWLRANTRKEFYEGDEMSFTFFNKLPSRNRWKFQVIEVNNPGKIKIYEAKPIMPSRYIDGIIAANFETSKIPAGEYFAIGSVDGLEVKKRFNVLKKQDKISQY